MVHCQLWHLADRLARAGEESLSSMSVKQMPDGVQVCWLPGSQEPDCKVASGRHAVAAVGGRLQGMQRPAREEKSSCET